MMMLTVEIDKEKDLPMLQAILNRLELKYHLYNEDHIFTDAELEGINAGLADIEAGRVHTHEQVEKRIQKKIADLRNG